MTRLSPRERGLAVVVVAVLACLLIAFFVVLPMRGAAADLADQERQLSEKIAEAETMYRALPAAQEEVERLRAQHRDSFRSREKEVTPEVMREIGEVCSDEQVSLSKVQTSVPETIEDCVRHPLTFTVHASFARIVSLLYELEQQPNRLWVEGVVISPGGRGGDLQATVHVATYTVSAKEEVADATR